DTPRHHLRLADVGSSLDGTRRSRADSTSPLTPASGRFPQRHRAPLLAAVGCAPDKRPSIPEPARSLDQPAINGIGERDGRLIGALDLACPGERQTLKRQCPRRQPGPGRATIRGAPELQLLRSLVERACRGRTDPGPGGEHPAVTLVREVDLIMGEVARPGLVPW